MSTTTMPRVSISPSDGMITRRQLLADALAGTSALSLSSIACATPRSDTRTPSSTSLRTGDVRDFDFLVGTWDGVNRRLRKRWVGSNDWDIFPGRLRCESRLGSVVNTVLSYAI
jgi:hypothetical protein